MSIKNVIKNSATTFLTHYLCSGVVFIILIANYRWRGRVGLAQFIWTADGGRMKRFLETRFCHLLIRSYPLESAALFHAIQKEERAVLILERFSLNRLPASALSDYLASLIRLGRFAEAHQLLEKLPPDRLNASFWQWRAYLQLMQCTNENEDLATDILMNLAKGQPDIVRPRQNLADHSPGSYQPNHVDWAAGAQGLVYDAYNFLSQIVTHVGTGQAGAQLYSRAHAFQERLQACMPACSSSLADWLSARNLDIASIRIAPPEWAAKIGHIGMLDILIRMRTLGWWSKNLVILADPAQISNRPALDLFKDMAVIAIRGENIPSNTFDELNSFQRFLGLSFNGWQMPDGEFLPWQDAGAQAIQLWEHQNLGHPLRDAYDRLMLDDKAFSEIRAEWGMAPDDWFVCLHIRDSGFYGEPQGTGQTHRNADITHYLAALQWITSRGGWVIRMGAADSQPLPPMPQVIDYARRGPRSAAMDLHLIRRARFFIGTTSGLTNIAVSFGVPCALINCITTDAQLWSSDTRFALKPILNPEGHLLDQSDLTGRFRWALYSSESLEKFGLTTIENTAEEIMATVAEVDAIAAARLVGDLPTLSTIQKIWRKTLHPSYYYGNGLPASFYIEKYFIPGKHNRNNELN